MSEFTFQFPIEELVQRFREVIKEEMAAKGNTALNDTNNEKPITTKELCKFLNVTELTLHRWRNKGKIPFFQIGSAVRYNKNEVLEALRKKAKQ
ncbi:MAG: helix-turn-helix domain-containing protein [Ginsengibacter sp.]